MLALFERTVPLGKAPREAYDWRRWLILKDLLKKWVAQGVAYKVHDFISRHTE